MSFVNETRLHRAQRSRLVEFAMERYVFPDSVFACVPNDVQQSFIFWLLCFVLFAFSTSLSGLGLHCKVSVVDAVEVYEASGGVN